MNIRHYILGTAGHIDHGKSALIRALTGVDPDRLPEEKARGITIDLGFAHLELRAPAGGYGGDAEAAPGSERQPGADAFDLGIVDVPGHEDFVKNMVAGVGSIDLALFVVAADDGWMPQSEEHLRILGYLGVKRAVFALTKVDLVGDGREQAIARVREALRDSPFADAPVVATSVVTGEGLDELKARLSEVLAHTPAPPDIGKPRLPVDRAFSLRGVGTVVTGTLAGGRLRRGEAVVIEPAGRTARIRSVQSHGREVTEAVPGTRTAVNLPDVAIGATSTQEGASVRRGDVLTLGEFGGAQQTWDVWLQRSDRLGAGTRQLGAQAIKSGRRVRIHHGAGNWPAHLVLLKGNELNAGGVGLAQLRFESPVFGFAGDRFIVRDWAEQCTLAGGVLLDEEARRKGFHLQERFAFLSRRAASLEDPLVWVRTQLAKEGACRQEQILRQSRFSKEAVGRALGEGAKEKRFVVESGVAADALWWSELRKVAAEAVDVFHKGHPEQIGPAISEIRSLLDGRLPFAEVFGALLLDLCRTEFEPVQGKIRRRTHRLELPPALEAAGKRIRAALGTKALEPPSRKELTREGPMRQAMRFLIDTGEVVEVGGEVVLLAGAYRQATDVVKRCLQSRGEATVSELRQALGSSRRIVVPLLERLDREGVTQRVGDKRRLR